MKDADEPAIKLRYRDVNNLNILLGLLLVRFGILDLMHDIQTLNRSSENGVLIIKPWLYQRQ